MFKNTLFFTLILLMAYNLNAQQKVTHEYKDSLNQIVKTYQKLRIKASRKTASEKDIDNLFELVHEDFIYTHSNYNAKFTKDSFQKLFLKNRETLYNDFTVDSVNVKNSIIGLNRVVLERTYFFRNTKTKKLKESTLGMSIYELKDGKISKISDHW